MHHYTTKELRKRSFAALRMIGILLFFLLFANLAVAENKTDVELNIASQKIQNLVQIYTIRLFPFQDPFARIFNVDAGKILFDRMFVRKSQNKWVPSPLSKVNDALNNFYASEIHIDKNLIHDVIKDAEQSLEANSTKIDLQSNLLALEFLSHYLHRFEELESSKTDTNSEEKKKEEEKNKTKKKPEYPETPDKYKPHTKDTDNKDQNEKEEPFVVAEVNFETAYFGQRYFSEIQRHSSYPFQEAKIPGAIQKPSSGKGVSTEMIVRTFGKRQVRLFLPPYYTPLQSDDPRVEVKRNDKGSYDMTLSADLEEVKIPLSNSVLEKLSPPVLHVYTRPVGFFKWDEWPSLIRTSLFQRFPPNEDHSSHSETLAQSIAAHIATNYLYSVGERKETDPIQALEAGAFQCDMAAYAMIALLRDVYKIPSRVVGGYRAKKFKSGADKKSYLVLPNEAHVWVEIYSNGKWIPYDPTPIKKDKKDDQDKEDSEYTDRNLENPLIPPPKPDDSSSSKVDGENTLAKEDQLKKDTEDRLKDLAKDQDANADSNSEGKSKDDSKTDSKTDMDSEELARKLELGSLEMDPQSHSNPLKDRALRVLLQLILDPNNTGNVTLDHLHKAKSVFSRIKDSRLEEIYKEALRIHESDHENLATWIRQVNLNLSTRDLADTYRDIYRIKKSVEFFASVVDEDQDRELAVSLIKILDKIQSEIQTLAHVDSKDIASVLKFYDSLPALVKSYLQEQYHLKTVGSNAPTKTIARLIKEGSLNDLRLLASLYPLTDYITSTRPRPEFEEVLSWQRDTQRPMGHDLMLLQRFSELARALYLQAGQSLENNLRDNTAYVMTRRKRLQNSTGRGRDDSEKITIVLYDISGSMSGTPAHFQAGLISAFTARALSEVSASGHQKHRVVLIPFDDKPGTPKPITTKQEALELIHNYSSKLEKANGGTDIQKAMIQALALIADAEKRSGEALAAANIILMSDGGSQVNLEELTHARNAIDRNTPVQALFIAIGDTNKDLIQFAIDSKSVGFENGFYYEFSKQLMDEYLKEASDTMIAGDESALYTEHSAQSLNKEVSTYLHEANRLAFALSERAREINRVHKSSLQHYQDLESLRWKHVKRDRVLVHHLERLRLFVKNIVFKNNYFLQRVCDDLMMNMERLTGIPLSEFDDVEQEHLRHLLQFASGLET